MTGAWLWCKLRGLMPGVQDEGHSRPPISGDGKFYCTICGKLLPGLPKP